MSFSAAAGYTTSSTVNSKSQRFAVSVVVLVLIAATGDLPTASAWSMGPFAMKMPFVRSRSSGFVSAQSSADTGPTPSSDNAQDYSESMALSAKPGAVRGSRSRIHQEPSQPVTTSQILVDASSFTLDDSFRASTVDMLYRQSLQRAGLE